jgi:hypothetical protein
MRTTLVALALCAVVSSADARYVYRWSENGVDHYSDVERAGAERIWVSDDGKSGSHGPAKAAPAEAEPDPAAALKDPKSPEFKKMRCEQRSAQLKQFEGASKLTERNAAGEEHEYTPEEREKLIAQTKADVERYCGAAETP